MHLGELESGIQEVGEVEEQRLRRCKFPFRLYTKRKRLRDGFAFYLFGGVLSEGED